MTQRDFQLIETNGIRLRAVVAGSGPLIVLVHGWPESWYSYRHQLEPLTQAGFRIAAIDVRGYGGSDKPSAVEAYAMRELCADVAGVISALGAGPAILIGHDWGAPIVWTTSLLHRSLVRAVIGMSVPYTGHPKRPSIDSFREFFKDRFFYQLYFQREGVAERELEADIPRTLRMVYYGASGDMTGEESSFLSHKGPDTGYLEQMIDPSELPSWLTQADLDYYAEQFRGSGFRGPLNRYRNAERDFAELAELAGQKITQPALFIAGTKDPVLHFRPGRLLSDGMERNYTDLRGKVLIEGAGHWVQQEAAAEVNAALLQFLAGL